MSPPTDNGGSTGRIRQEQGGIAWGDLRNCLNQIIIEPSTASALFEYRFTGEGELSGHNLGNLMLKALEDMHIRPIEAINLIRELPKVKSSHYSHVRRTCSSCREFRFRFQHCR